MRMSLPGYAALGIATLMVMVAVAQSKNLYLLLTTLPMLAALIVIPLLLTRMNQRAMANVDCSAAKPCRLDQLQQKGNLYPVRVRGTVANVAFAWMNRPHITITEGDASVKVIMFTAPQVTIKEGDYVEAVGTLRSFGFGKEKKIWGVRVMAIPRRTQHNKGRFHHNIGAKPQPEQPLKA